MSTYSLYGQTVSNTFGRLVQVIDGQYYYDGFGNPLSIGAGSTGPTGPSGDSILWMGDWDDRMLYYYYDAVHYNGSSYIYKYQGPSNHTTPNLDSGWSILVLSGDNGTSGTSGATGPMGPIGPTGPPNGTSGTSGTSIDTSSFVPYINSINDLDLGTYSLNANIIYDSFTSSTLSYNPNGTINTITSIGSTGDKISTLVYNGENISSIITTYNNRTETSTIIRDGDNILSITKVVS